MKNVSHCTLVGGTCIVKTKQHDCIVKMHIGVQKAVFSTFRVHLDMVIVSETIHERKYRVTSSGIDQHIDV